MNTAPRAVVTPPMAASRTAATVWPFLNATRPAKTAAVINAICRGPSVELVPNSTIVRTMSTIRTTTGATASSRVGRRGCRPIVWLGSATARNRSGRTLGNALGANRARLRPLRAPAKDELPHFGHDDDGCRNPKAGRPFRAAQGRGREDGVEKPKLGRKDDRHRGQERGLEQGGVPQYLAAEDRHPFVRGFESKQQVEDGERRQAHGPSVLDTARPFLAVDHHQGSDRHDEPHHRDLNEPAPRQDRRVGSTRSSLHEARRSLAEAKPDCLEDADREVDPQRLQG